MFLFAWQYSKYDKFYRNFKSKNINYKVILKANQRNQIIPEMNKRIIDILKNNNSEYKILDLEKLNKKKF